MIQFKLNKFGKKIVDTPWSRQWDKKKKNKWRDTIKKKREESQLGVNAIRVSKFKFGILSFGLSSKSKSFALLACLRPLVLMG